MTVLKARFKKSLWHFDLDVDLNIQDQIMVLWGPSGCGKTTVLNILAGLLVPDEGSIDLNRRLLFSSRERINVPARQRRIGYLFQDYALFPHKTVLQNALYGIRSQGADQVITRQDVLRLLESFGVQHLVDRYPGQISGGEKQRIALVRALAVNPRLLLLDEPFSALDYDNKISLRQELKKLNQHWQIPFIMVAHDREDAEYLGDIILKMEAGRVVDLKTSEPVLYASKRPLIRTAE